jgi:hypothetical protein
MNLKRNRAALPTMNTTNYTCNICNEHSVIENGAQQKRILCSYGCDPKIHQKAEDSAPLASKFKCQLCNRTTMRTKKGDYYDGCNVFERHKELRIVGFHDVCFQAMYTKGTTQSIYQSCNK